MLKETIKGVTYTNFGSNNYSCGMEMVIFHPKTIKVQDVMMLPNIFLHPTAKPNSEEIFALKGDIHQYMKFIKAEIEGCAAKAGFDKFGNSFEDTEVNAKREKYIDECELNFKPWWHKE